MLKHFTAGNTKRLYVHVLIKTVFVFGRVTFSQESNAPESSTWPAPKFLNFV